MKRYLGFSLLFLTLAFIPGRASDIPEDWQGLWEVKQVTETGSVTLYLWLPVGNKGDATLYGEHWNPLALSTWSVRGSELTFNWQTKGLNTFFKGTKKSQTVAGDWQLVHPQYVLKRNFTARKLHSLENWTPVAFSPLPDRRTRIIDGSSIGLEHLQKGTYDEFEARFLAVAGGRGSLSAMKQTLENGPFQKDNAEVRSILEEIVKRLDDTYSGYSLPVGVVLLPIGDFVDHRVLMDRQFVLFNPAKLDSKLAPERRKGLIARSLFERGLPYDLPRIDGEILLLWKRSVPIGLVRSIGIAEHPASIVQVTPEEYERLWRRLPALKSAWRAGNNSLSEIEQDVLALAFAEHLGSHIAPTRLGMLHPDQMKQLYRDFIQPAAP